jgi:hypothetical protein
MVPECFDRYDFDYTMILVCRTNRRLFDDEVTSLVRIEFSEAPLQPPVLIRITAAHRLLPGTIAIQGDLERRARLQEVEAIELLNMNRESVTSRLKNK